MKRRPLKTKPKLQRRSLKNSAQSAKKGSQRKLQRRPMGGTGFVPKQTPDGVEIINPMNPKVKRAWVQALRSGQYLQQEEWVHYLASRPLKKKTAPWRFSVLGVLCDLYFQQHSKRDWEDFESPTHQLLRKVAPKSRETICLPNYVVKWAGLQHNPDPKNVVVYAKYSAPGMEHKNGPIILPVLGQISDFDYIAECIEKNL